MPVKGKKRPEGVQRSSSWRFFKPVSKGIAKCFICRRILSYKTSTSNLKRHLFLVHGGVYEEMLQMLPQSKVGDDINVVSLINCVKMYPCLWDTRCSTYGESQLQHNAWNDIAVKLKPQEDLNLVVTKISDQFNMLRNTYFSTRRFMYHEELSFLNALLDPQEHTVQGNMLIPEEIKVESGDQDEHAADNGDIVNERTLQQSQCPMNQSATDGDTTTDTSEISANQRCEEVSDTSIRQTTDPEKTTTAYTSTECTLHLNKVDSETFFLLSLATDMRRIPRERQMGLRREILSLFSDVIKKYENE